MGKIWHGYRLGKKKVFEIALEKSSGCGILVKKRAGMRDQDPFSDTSLGQHFRGWSWGRRPTHLLEVSIELFSFYALFSLFRPRDALQGICLLSFQKICIYMSVEIVLCGTIT